MTDQPHYPHSDGERAVLGPEVFASADGETISWQGANYRRQRAAGGHEQLREQIAAALTAAAHRCDGNCGLTERACYAAHPITWSAMAGGTTHIDGSVTAIADTVLAVVQQREQRLVDAHQATIGQLRRSEAAVARVRDLRADLRGITGARWIADALDTILGDAPAHDGGPTVREAAANDAAHWNDKYAGEGQ